MSQEISDFEVGTTKKFYVPITIGGVSPTWTADDEVVFTAKTAKSATDLATETIQLTATLANGLLEEDSSLGSIARFTIGKHKTKDHDVGTVMYWDVILSRGDSSSAEEYPVNEGSFKLLERTSDVPT